MKWDFIVIFHTYVEGLKLEERIERALQVVISFTTCQKKKFWKPAPYQMYILWQFFPTEGLKGKVVRGTR